MEKLNAYMGTTANHIREGAELHSYILRAAGCART